MCLPDHYPAADGASGTRLILVNVAVTLTPEQGTKSRQHVLYKTSYIDIHGENGLSLVVLVVLSARAESQSRTQDTGIVAFWILGWRVQNFKSGN